jgi:hypothetical protein
LTYRRPDLVYSMTTLDRIVTPAQAGVHHQAANV